MTDAEIIATAKYRIDLLSGPEAELRSPTWIGWDEIRAAFDLAERAIRERDEARAHPHVPHHIHDTRDCRICLEMQQTEDALREKAEALAKALEDLPCYFCWRDRREGKLRVACENYTTEDGDLPEAAWCPSCKARAALAVWKGQ